jgi:ferrous iron transport protein A
VTGIVFDQTENPAEEAQATLLPLGQGRKGMKGVVAGVGVATDGGGAVSDAELERRLLEIGFVEGAKVEILHEGLFGRDPIVVRLDDARVALRRREAAAVLVRLS